MDKKSRIIVTGAADSPCSDIALEMARCGAQVLLVDDEKEKLDVVRQRIEDIGGRAIVYVCNLNDAKAVARLAKEIISTFGRCQYLISGKGDYAVELLDADTNVKIRAEGSYVEGWVERRADAHRPLCGGDTELRRKPRLDLCI